MNASLRGLCLCLCAVAADGQNMRMFKALSRRDDRAKQVLGRLSALDPYGAVQNADAADTARRLARLRNGTVGGRAGA